MSLSSSAFAAGVEDCEVYDPFTYTYTSNSTFLCATALEFGTFAANLRDAINARSGFGGQSAQAAMGDLSVLGFNEQVTRGLAFSQTTGDRPKSGLAFANGQVTRGNFTGFNTNLMVGADVGLSSDFSLGALVYVGRGSVTAPSGVRLDRTEVLAGPYFSYQLGNGDGLSGYLLYGQPAYEVNYVPSNGESLVGSMTYSHPIVRDGIDYTPFAAVSVKREWPDSINRVDAAILTLGSSFEGEVVQGANGVRQFFGRVEMDIGNYSDTFGNDVSYVAPRIGAGARFGLSNGAALQFLANASAASDQTTIFSAQVSYRMAF